MYNIAILGCENSHANSFLDYIAKNEQFRELNIAGVYSIDPEASKKLHDSFGVHVMERPDELVGKLDALIITARHGGSHYEFARPYIPSGIPMFIDKPITVSEEDAIAFYGELRAHGVRFTGGSSLMYSPEIRELADIVSSGSEGKLIGGFLRAPVNLDNPHGGFYFYAQHLVTMMTEIYGYYPESVYAHENSGVITCTVSYGGYDVVLSFVDGNYKYHATISFEGSCVSRAVTLDGVFEKEFDEFYHMLADGSSGADAGELFAPVFIMNAIERSLGSGMSERISYPIR